MPFTPEKRAYLLAIFGDEDRVRRLEEELAELGKELEGTVAFKALADAHTFEELDQSRVGELLEMFVGISSNILAGDDTPEEKERLLVKAAQDFTARVAPAAKASKVLRHTESPVQPFIDQLARRNSGGPAAAESKDLRQRHGGAAALAADLLAGRVERSIGDGSDGR